jgi:hypothetical protein
MLNKDKNGLTCYAMSNFINSMHQNNKFLLIKCIIELCSNKVFVYEVHKILLMLQQGFFYEVNKIFLCTQVSSSIVRIKKN